MAHSIIDDRVKTIFSNYHLKVQLGGIRFSTLGEFRRPGKHVVLQNQITIFEAIALSGDLTTVADRENLHLVRQYPEGTRIHTVNLLDQNIISTPYYFLHPNDVVYAEPLPERWWGIEVNGAQTLGVVMNTLATSGALILSLISLNR